MGKEGTQFEELLKGIGDNIRRVRSNRGYTLDQLGGDIGVDKSNMLRIEQGKNITLLTLLKISAVLEVRPIELFPEQSLFVHEDIEKYMKKKNKKVGVRKKAAAKKAK